MNNEHTIHNPVMLNEMLECLAPVDGEVYIDGTFGAGGYTKAILDKANCFVYGIDRDATVAPIADEVKNQYSDRFSFINSKFSEMGRGIACYAQETQEKGHSTLCPYTTQAPVINGIVIDLGVSSMQLDQAERGFSFMKDAPLDMRMGQDGITAEELIQQTKEEDLANIIYEYGDERASRKIARAIKHSEEPITTTKQLAEVIHKTIGSRSGKIDSATKTFQALRIYVNDELGELKKALEVAEEILAPDGRLIVIAFHSLEDRIVKEFLRNRTGGGGASRHIPLCCDEKVITFNYISKKALKPSNAEVSANPRSRSARLRCARRVV